MGGKWAFRVVFPRRNMTPLTCTKKRCSTGSSAGNFSKNMQVLTGRSLSYGRVDRRIGFGRDIRRPTLPWLRLPSEVPSQRLPFAYVPA